MRKSILSTLLAGGLTVAAGAAFADGPVALTDTQMDGVSAGATAVSAALAGGFGDVLNATQIDQVSLVSGNNAVAYSNARNISASIVFGAASLSAQQVVVTN